MILIKIKDNSVTSFNINSYCKIINEEVFQNCLNLTNVVIPEGVMSIGKYAFSGCRDLTSVTLPASLITIGLNAFSSCSNLINIYYAGTIDQWVSIEFASNTSNPLSNGAELYINGEKLTNLTINENINDYAFYGYNSLTSVIIGEDVTSIGSSAFYGCKNLKSVSILSENTQISPDAFIGCESIVYNVYENGYYLGNENNPYLILSKIDNKSSISEFNIHPDCEQILNQVFSGCSSLRYIHMLGTALKSAFSLSGTWVKTDSPDKPSSWTSTVGSIPAGTSGYFHQKSAWDLV